jgi:hypothetical protein
MDSFRIGNKEGWDNLCIDDRQAIEEGLEQLNTFSVVIIRLSQL